MLEMNFHQLFNDLKTPQRYSNQHVLAFRHHRRRVTQPHRRPIGNKSAGVANESACRRCQCHRAPASDGVEQTAKQHDEEPFQSLWLVVATTCASPCIPRRGWRRATTCLSSSNLAGVSRSTATAPAEQHPGDLLGLLWNRVSKQKRHLRSGRSLTANPTGWEGFNEIGGATHIFILVSWLHWLYQLVRLHQIRSMSVYSLRLNSAGSEKHPGRVWFSRRGELLLPLADIDCGCET